MTVKDRVVITRGMNDHEYLIMLESFEPRYRMPAAMYGDRWEVYDYVDSKRLVVSRDGRFVGAIYGDFEIVERV